MSDLTEVVEHGGRNTIHGEGELVVGIGAVSGVLKVSSKNQGPHRNLLFSLLSSSAGAAVLSSRWRDTFSGVHTIFVEQTEDSVPTYDDVYHRDNHGDCQPRDLDMPSHTMVTDTCQTYL